MRESIEVTARQLLPVWAVAAVGLVVGALVGLRAPTQYEGSLVVQLDQGLQLRHFDAVPHAAAFGDILIRDATRRQAAELAGLSPDDLPAVYSERRPDTPIVVVTSTGDDPDAVAAALVASAEAGLSEQLAQERKVLDVTLGAARDELSEAQAVLDPLIEAAGQGPQDLDRVVQDRTFSLTSARSQLEQTEDSYWLTRLPGDIEAYEQILDDVEPVLADWRIAQERVNQAEAEIGPLETREAELERADEVIAAGAPWYDVEVGQVGRRRSVGRLAAVGALAGAALGALVLSVTRLGRASGT